MYQAMNIVPIVWTLLGLLPLVLLDDADRINNEGKKNHPNIILILADDLGYGDLASTGHPTSMTPNLDRLAAESKVFTSFYAASPVCSPSRAALLTGMYPVTTGIWPGVLFPDDVGGLDPGRFQTLATMLKNKAGYRTAAVGKWHIGVGKDGRFLPHNHGFDTYLGIPYSHAMCPCPVCFPLQEKCEIECSEEYVGCPLLDGAKVIEQPAVLPTLTEKYTQRALNVIEEGSYTKEPFFLYMAYAHTHHPQFAGEGFRNTTLRGQFGDSLAEMDHSIGVILSSVRKQGIENNTLVFFTSDNGPCLGRGVEGGNAGPLRCGKGTTYEGGMRVPAFAHMPNEIKNGREHGLIASIDIVPTIMSWLNLNLDDNSIHGVDQTTMIFGEGETSREDYVFFPHNPDPKVGFYAIRSGSFKAHFYTEGADMSSHRNPDFACRPTSTLMAHDPPIVFNLDLDPGERHPLEPADHKDLIQKFRDIKEGETARIQWAPSERNKGKNEDYELCCNRKPGCTPFPKCCDCAASQILQ